MSKKCSASNLSQYLYKKYDSDAVAEVHFVRKHSYDADAALIELRDSTNLEDQDETRYARKLNRLFLNFRK